MGGYAIYTPVRTVILRDVKDLTTKDERRDPTFVDGLVSKYISMPGANRTLDAAVMLDEMEWLDTNCRTYFPESADLLQTLWRAKMDVSMEDLKLASFPRAFVVNWPACSIDGSPLRGCMVWMGNGHERIAALRRFGIRYMGGPATPIGAMEDPDEILMQVSYMGAKKELGITPIFRCSIPGRLLKACLKSDKDFVSHLHTYNDGGVVGAIPLTETEWCQQYVVARSVIHLMVYMKACPEVVRDGYPAGRRGKEFGMPWMPDMSPTSIAAPVPRGTHDSPMVHWRDWHFRTFPRKHDGNKKAGFVFVKGTMVNAETIDPKTVEVVEWKGDQHGT